MTDQALLDQLLASLPGFLTRQRWFARAEGAEEGELPRVVLVDHQELAKGPPGLLWLVVDADGSTYQVLVGTRPDTEAAELVAGNDDALVAPVDGSFGRALAYEATLDPELNRILLEVASEEELDRFLGDLPATVHLHAAGVDPEQQWLGHPPFRRRNCPRSCCGRSHSGRRRRSAEGSSGSRRVGQ